MTSVPPGDPVATDRPATDSHRLLVAATVLAGALLSVQARVNGALTARLGSAVLTALVSFSVGTAALALLLVGRRRRRPARGLATGPRPRWWWFCGGFGGAFLVTSSAIAVPKVGVALLGVGIVAGQTLGSLAVDEVGLSPRGRQPITTWRLAGAAIALTALVVAAAGQRDADLQVGLLALIALAGAGVAVQQAANGHLQRLSGEALVAATISFAVGTAALVAAVGVVAVSRGLAPDWPGGVGLYLGGLCGATYITLSAAAVGRLGVLRLTLGTVAGQLLGALALDVLRPTAEGPRPVTLVAAGLALAAVAVGGRQRDADRPKVVQS